MFSNMILIRNNIHLEFVSSKVILIINCYLCWNFDFIFSVYACSINYVCICNSIAAYKILFPLTVIIVVCCCCNNHLFVTKGILNFLCKFVCLSIITTINNSIIVVIFKYITCNCWFLESMISCIEFFIILRCYKIIIFILIVCNMC